MNIADQKIVLIALFLIALSLFVFVSYVSPNSDSGLVASGNDSENSVQEDTSTAVGTGIINFRPARR